MATRATRVTRAASAAKAVAGAPLRRLETPTLSQSELNIDEKSRSNPLTWKGQFSPQLVEAHLRHYTKPGDQILDPFAGSGTVLLEGLRQGARPIGAEINPAAVILARLYAASGFEEAVRERALRRVEDSLALAERACGGLGPLFPGEANRPSMQCLTLLKSFNKPSLESDFAEALIVAADIFRNPEWQMIANRWRGIRDLVMSLPCTEHPPRIYLADARSLPLPAKSIDLVFTSPPYINVFNYHQQYRASAEALGWDILPIARSEIGSNRKFRSNRFVTVAQYCLDMMCCLREVCRVLKKDGRAIFVLGRESNVRKTPFYNGHIIAMLAERAVGMRVVLSQEREFVNRFGTRIVEDVLHLMHGGRAPVEAAAWAAARGVAAEVLADARDRVSDTTLVSDLDDAIKKAQTVQPSPILSLSGQPIANSLLHHTPDGGGKLS